MLPHGRRGVVYCWLRQLAQRSVLATSIHGHRQRLLVYNHECRRTLASGFFSQLKESLRKEVEQNKEFKESLQKLKNETGNITGKAQKETSKLTKTTTEYVSSFTSKVSESTEAASKRAQSTLETAYASLSQLKQAFQPEEKPPQHQREAVHGHAGDAKRRQRHAAADLGAEQPSTRTNARRAQEGQAMGRGDAAAQSKGDIGQGRDGQQGQDDSKAHAAEGPEPKAQAAEENVTGGNFYTRMLNGRTLGEATGAWAMGFRDELKEAWAELFGLKEQSSGMRKQLFKPAQEGDGKEEEQQDAPSTAQGGALVVVKSPQHTWERLVEKLRDAPIIQEILKASSKLADTELGKQAQKLRTSLHDRVEDAREMWETSQNPLVYKLSSMWDDLTSETELGIALREIRRADPEFVLEDWVANISEHFLPEFFRAYLKGDLKALTPHLSDGLRKQLAEEFRLRKTEGLVLDPNVLEISNTEVIQAKLHDHKPVLMVGALIQHINCVRDRDGQVVEGKEDEVRASFYLLLFVREFNEKEGALEWKISERYLGFSQAYY